VPSVPAEAPGYLPGHPSNRIAVLDALRGFALFGVLLANLNGWSGWEELGPEARAALSSPTGARIYEFARNAFVDGKFYTLFSMLFGTGICLQLRQWGDAGVPRHVRRMGVLAIVGLLHMSLLYLGDILLPYAICGLLLLPLRRLPDRALLGGSVALLLFPVLGQAVANAIGLDPSLGLDRVGANVMAALGGPDAPPATDWLAWMLRPDLRSYLAFHLAGPFFRFAGLFGTWRFPKLLGIMLIGLWLGRRLGPGAAPLDRGMLRRVLVVAGAVGLPASLVYGWLGGLEQKDPTRHLAATAAYALGVVPLALAYASGFALLWPRAGRVLGLLVAPGRMALTNYLLQSVVSTALFFGVGLGLAGRFPPWAIVATAVAIYAVQALGSHLWLTRFRSGPFEWAWRRVAFGSADVK
jgi:uncharacterized protein